MYNLEQAVGSIGLYMNANKTEFLYFKQEEIISTLSGRPLKLLDKSTYLSSNISSAESYVNINLAKVWTTINRLLIIWKFDLSDRIEQDFFHIMAVSILLYGCTTLMLMKCMENKNATCYFEQILSTIPHNTTAVQPLSSHLTNHPSKTNKICGGTVEKARMNS